MLTWIKKRVRYYEAFDWACETDDRPYRRGYLIAAIEDWKWMTSGGMAVSS